MDPHLRLSRRERQIMDAIYARGQATAAEVWGDLPDAPSRTSVRTFLRILEEKGLLRHRQAVPGGREFVYLPIRQRTTAGRSALQRVLSTFFGGSVEQALAAYLADGKKARSLKPEELQRLARLIEEARKE